MNSKRLTLTENRRGGGYPDETARIQANPLVKQELDINHQLSEKLIRQQRTVTSWCSAISSQNWLDRALQSERDIKEQISVLRGACCCRVFFTNSNRHYRRRMSCRI